MLFHGDAPHIGDTVDRSLPERTLIDRVPLAAKLPLKPPLQLGLLYSRMTRFPIVERA